jgi:hypothetical protein
MLRVKSGDLDKMGLLFNGDVDITLPPIAKANVKMLSAMGEIYSDFEIDIDKSSSKI